MANTATISEIGPGEVDAEIACRTARRIGDYLASHLDDDPIEIKVEGDDSEVLVVPRAGAALLAAVMTAVANGQGVTVVPSGAQLTTQQAADILNVSRPYLISLLEKREIDYSLVGRHRRIPFQALMDYKRRSDRAARAAADELSALSQELGR
jgi:excisionase family DNA binding protein